VTLPVSCLCVRECVCVLVRVLLFACACACACVCACACGTLVYTQGLILQLKDAVRALTHKRDQVNAGFSLV
jgi:hypothetical protein